MKPLQLGPIRWFWWQIFDVDCVGGPDEEASSVLVLDRRWAWVESGVGIDARVSELQRKSQLRLQAQLGLYNPTTMTFC